jgi:hypothetical protein
MAMGHYEIAVPKGKKVRETYGVIKKLEKFFSGFITCWGRKNAFCDSRISLCLPCIKLRFIFRYGRLPYSFGINVKDGAYYFYAEKRFTCTYALFMSFKTQRRWKSIEDQWIASLKVPKLLKSR